MRSDRRPDTKNMKFTEGMGRGHRSRIVVGPTWRATRGVDSRAGRTARSRPEAETYVPDANAAEEKRGNPIGSAGRLPRGCSHRVSRAARASVGSANAGRCRRRVERRATRVLHGGGDGAAGVADRFAVQMNGLVRLGLRWRLSDPSLRGTAEQDR